MADIEEKDVAALKKENAEKYVLGNLDVAELRKENAEKDAELALLRKALKEGGNTEILKENILKVGSDEYRLTIPNFNFENKAVDFSVLAKNKKLVDKLIKIGFGGLVKVVF